jgi:hypothetical protein
VELDVAIRQPDPQLAFLRELVEEHATIAGDVVEIGVDTWVIHGSIPVDGEAILAEYDSEDQARAALDQLGPPERTS